MSEKRTMLGAAADIAATLNKKFKTSSLRIKTGMAPDSVSNVTEWVSSGCQLLDLAISNQAYGGFPCGRITVLYGPEQSGKSLIGMHAIAETQRKGGIALYVDAERSLHQGFAEAIGVDLSTLNVIENNELEYVFQAVTAFIHEVRAHDSDILITVVIDSMAALMMDDDDKKGKDGKTDDFSIKGYNTKKAMAFSDGMPKLVNTVSDNNVCMIITNQARYKLNVTNKFESPWKQSGGQAIPHYASVIVYMQKSGKIKAKVNNIERIVGRSTSAKIEKNRLGPPEVKMVFDIYFDRGVDNFTSWGHYIDAFEICKKTGSFYSYSYVDETTGEITAYRAHGWAKFCKDVLEQHPEVAKQIWEKLAEQFVATYRTKSNNLDVVHEEVSDDDVEQPYTGEDDE